MNKNILCLDFGKTMGWAIYKNETIFSGTENLQPKRISGSGIPFLRFKQWLDGLIKNGDTYQSVYFEDVRRHLGVHAAHVYGAFWGTLTAWCEDHEIPYEGVGVGTIKKHATGKGNVKKPDMIAAMQAKGFTPKDDNEADALALLQWALEHEKID